jgi:hypothetical protein
MVVAGDIRYTDEFERMIQARDFTAEQAVAVVMGGRVTGEESSRGRPTRYVLLGDVERETGVRDCLAVELP